MSIKQFLPTYEYIHLSAYLSINQSINLSIYMTIRLTIYLSFCSNIYLFIYVPVSPRIYLYFYLSNSVYRLAYKQIYNYFQLLTYLPIYKPSLLLSHSLSAIISIYIASRYFHLDKVKISLAAVGSVCSVARRSTLSFSLSLAATANITCNIALIRAGVINR